MNCARYHHVAFAGIVGLCLAAAPALGAPCDRLSSAQQTLKKRLLDKTYPYDCCDEKLARCLEQRKVCKLARRLRDSICRRIRKGDDEKKIREILARRARSMTPTRKQARYDLSLAPAAGAAGAPVEVVVYACARCPYCSKVVPSLHRLVTSGGLKGKARVHFRPFPIKSHAGSVDGGLAFVAAMMQKGKLWPFLLKLYGSYDGFAKDKLPKWAAEAGLDRAAFTAALSTKQARKQLIAAKKEGLRNGVKATPTIYINGRQYHGELDAATLLDVLDEEYDRVKRRQYCK